VTEIAPPGGEFVTARAITRDEREAREAFAARYSAPRGDVHRRVERAVIGADFGTTGYTTRHQADRLAGVLELTPDDQLLDVGAGRGWPGVYLAVTIGCGVVLADMPEEGLRHAKARAAAEGVKDRVHTVAAAASRLPFLRGSFDAVVHTDVTCWLTAKLSVLRASRTALRPDGRTAFITIELVGGLDPQARRRAQAAAPRATASRRSYVDLLLSTGFRDVHCEDVTPAYIETLHAWLFESEDHEQELTAIDGREVVEERFAEWREAAAAAERGWLRRRLYWAQP
jgi:cyclopropane fatty-acyl-phospholipid synthase-like methyltransferase